MDLANNISYLRKKNGLTQEDLADYLHVSRQSVSKWETGESYPDTEKIIAICEKFNVTMDALVRGNLAETAKIDKEDTQIESISNNTSDKKDTESVFEDGSGNDDLINESEDENNQTTAVTWAERISQGICGLVMLVSLLVFLSIGLIMNIWHPTWISMVCGACVCAVIGIIFDLRKGKKDIRKIMGSCCGILMCLTAFAYVILNTLIGKWHPSWIMFPIASLICAIMGILGDIFDKKAK